MRWRVKAAKQHSEWQGLIDIAEIAALLGLFWLVSIVLGL